MAVTDDLKQVADSVCQAVDDALTNNDFTGLGNTVNGLVKGATDAVKHFTAPAGAKSRPEQPQRERLPQEEHPERYFARAESEQGPKIAAVVGGAMAVVFGTLTVIFALLSFIMHGFGAPLVVLMGLMTTLAEVFEPKNVYDDEQMPSALFVAMHPNDVDFSDPYGVLEFNENIVAFTKMLQMPSGIVSLHDLLLPDSQKAFLKTVCSVTSNVIVVLTSGGALELGPYNDKVRAVLQAWYPGSQGGRAIAEVLTGRVDPTGRLPETFYYNDQVDWDFADYNMEGKTSRFFHKKPLYPFGDGMQYKKLELSGFKVEKSEDEKGVSTAVIMVSNPHDQTVSMPVELYAKVEEEGVRTPNFQLIGFKRVTLEAGKSVTVTMPIDPYWISVVDEDGSRRPATGKITYYAGDHQPDERSEELCGDTCLKA